MSKCSIDEIVGGSILFGKWGFVKVTLVEICMEVEKLKQRDIWKMR